MNKTICLIIPPSTFLLDERVFVSLGILRVAACLELEGHAVEMLDLSGIENFEECVRDHAANSKADMFGITATTPQMPAVVKVVQAIRQARHGVRIILGGPHVTLVGAALKRERKLGMEGRATRAFAKLLSLFDVLVCGDGEDAIFAAIQPEADRVIDADDPKSSMFLTNDRLNELPWPARHLVDLKSYRYTIDGVPATSALFQIGCPFACTFCGGRESPMLRRVRMRTTENVVSEIESIYTQYGYRSVMAYDDELNVNPKILELMLALESLQKKLGVEFRLRGFIKSQLLTDAQADAMYRAGFRWILVGFESGSDRILDNINKRASRAENTRCMEIAKRHGLKVKALMSIGHAGETEDTVRETKEWLLEVKPDDFDCTVITVFPGCPYFDFAVRHPENPNDWTFTAPKSKDRLHSYEVDYMEVEDFYKGKPGEYVSYVYTDSIPAHRFPILRDELESEVRQKLGIKFNPAGVTVRYEHSTGMSQMPPFILKTTQ